jgi:hypothetical protein
MVKFNKQNSKKISMIDMNSYGIKMMVSTNHEYIEYVVKIVKETIKTNENFDVLTVLQRYNQIYLKLKMNDNYFEKDINRAKIEKERWNEFIDDCIVYVALAYILVQKPIMLVHPETKFDKIKFKTPLNTINLPNYMAK